MWWGLAMCPAGMPLPLLSIWLIPVLLSLFLAQLCSPLLRVWEKHPVVFFSGCVSSRLSFSQLSVVVPHLVAAVRFNHPCALPWVISSSFIAFWHGRVTAAHQEMQSPDGFQHPLNGFCFVPFLLVLNTRIFKIVPLGDIELIFNYITFEYCSWVAVISPQSIISYRKLNLVFTLHITSHLSLSNVIAKAQSLLKFWNPSQLALAFLTSASWHHQ